MAKLIDLAKGEGDDGVNSSLVGDKNITPYAIKNFYKKKNIGLSMRPGNKIISTLTVNADETVNTMYECDLRNEIIVVITSPTAARILVYRISNSAWVQIGTLGPLLTPYAQIEYGITDGNAWQDLTLSPPFTLHGYLPVFIAGFDKLYFYDDDFVIKAYACIVTGTITTDPNTGIGTISSATWGNIWRPRDVLWAQNRLMVLGYIQYPGYQPVSTGNDTFFLASKSLRPFVNIYNDKDQTKSIQNPLPHSVIYYTINEFFKRIVLTSAREVTALYGTGSSELIEANATRSHITGTSGTTGIQPVVMGSALIYVTNNSLRMQYSQVITDIINVDAPDQQAATVVNYIPSKMLFDSERNLFYGWVDHEVKAFWWAQTEGGGQLLATSTYFSDEYFDMISYAPSTRYILLREANTNNHYFCQEDDNIGVGNNLSSDLKLMSTIYSVSPIPRAIALTVPLPNDVVGFWLYVPTNNSWNYFHRDRWSNPFYYCANPTLSISYIQAGVSYNLIHITGNMYTSIPTTYQKNMDILISTKIALSDPSTSENITDDNTKIIKNGTPFYLGMIDQTVMWVGTVTQKIAMLSSYPSISWWGASSYSGSWAVLYSIVLVTTWEIQKRFNVNLNKSIARSILNDNYTYSTYKFKKLSQVNDNTMTIEFRPKDSYYNVDDCLVKQLLLG
jgi:hypothetical protein